MTDQLTWMMRGLFFIPSVFGIIVILADDTDIRYYVASVLFAMSIGFTLLLHFSLKTDDAKKRELI